MTESLQILQLETDRLRDVEGQYDDLKRKNQVAQREREMRSVVVLRNTLDGLMLETPGDIALKELLISFRLDKPPQFPVKELNSRLYFADRYVYPQSSQGAGDAGPEVDIPYLQPGLSASQMIQASMSVVRAADPDLTDLDAMQAALSQVIRAVQTSQRAADDGYLGSVILLVFNHLLYGSRCDSVRLCIIIGLLAQLLDACDGKWALAGHLCIPAFKDNRRSSMLLFLTIAKVFQKWRSALIEFQDDELVDVTKTVPELIVDFIKRDIATNSDIVVRGNAFDGGFLIVMVDDKDLGSEVVFYQHPNREVSCWRGRWVVEEGTLTTWVVHMDPEIVPQGGPLTVTKGTRMEEWLVTYHEKEMARALGLEE